MTVSNGAADCISSFLRHRALIRTALVASYPQLDRVEHALEAFRAGELERNAELESGFAYAVHGRGLRMTGPDGEVVELDLLLDGTEAFDVWRLQEFARSIGMNPVPLGDDLARECLGMKQKGFFEEPEPAWFRIIE